MIFTSVAFQTALRDKNSMNVTWVCSGSWEAYRYHFNLKPCPLLKQEMRLIQKIMFAHLFASPHHYIMISVFCLINIIFLKKIIQVRIFESRHDGGVV